MLNFCSSNEGSSEGATSSLGRIRVNAWCPGVIRTPRLDAAIRQGFMSKGALAGLHSIDRSGKNEERAEAAAFLCSDRSARMTVQANGHGQRVGDHVAGSDYFNVNKNPSRSEFACK